MTDLIFDFQNVCKIENLFSKKLENKKTFENQLHSIAIYINI